MAVEVVPMIEVRKKLTPDDVWEMIKRGELDTHARWFELIEGEIVDVPPASGDGSQTELNVAGPLWEFARVAGGKAFNASAGFLVGKDHQQLRAPDAAYIAPDRVQESYPRWIDGAPDLAVEVLSRGQYGPAYAYGKIREYFEAGAQLVWLMDRRGKEVRVYRANSDVYTIYRNDAMLTLEPIIAGFQLKVSDIFR